MIYCVAFLDVKAHLQTLGFEEFGSDPDFRAFEDRRGRRLTLRTPNVKGALPEILVNDAFDAASLVPPSWDVFWCD